MAIGFSVMQNCIGEDHVAVTTSDKTFWKSTPDYSIKAKLPAVPC